MQIILAHKIMLQNSDGWFHLYLTVWHTDNWQCLTSYMYVCEINYHRTYQGNIFYVGIPSRTETNQGFRKPLGYCKLPFRAYLPCFIEQYNSTATPALLLNLMPLLSYMPLVLLLLFEVLESRLSISLFEWIAQRKPNCWFEKEIRADFVYKISRLKFLPFGYFIDQIF